MLGKELRILILLRDDFKCTTCGIGGKNSDYILEIHHKTPKAQGGGDEIDNLITLCIACHDLTHYGKVCRPTTFTDRRLRNRNKRGR